MRRDGYWPITQDDDEASRWAADNAAADLEVSLQSDALIAIGGARPLGVCERFARGDYTIVPRPEGQPFLDTWDIIVIIALGATAVLLPLEVALLTEVPTSLYKFDKVIDLVFAMDIVLTFFVAILPTVEDTATVSGDAGDQYVKAPRQIAQQYMAVPFSSNFTAGWFWPDVLTVFPWECAPMVARMSTLRMVRVLRLVRMLRLVRVVKLFKRWQTYSGVSYSFIKVSTCAICTLMLVHWLACLWGHLGLYPAGDQRVTWLSNHLTEGQQIDDVPIEEVYRISLYFCTVVLTTVGFGDVLPVNDIEVCVMIFTIFLTGITWAWVVATVVNVITNMDVYGTHFNQIMDDMNNLMSSRGISRSLRFRIRRHIQNSYKMQRERYNHAAIQWLSDGLQGELAIESGANRICDGIWYLNKKTVPNKVQIELADEFKGGLYSPQEYIVDRDKVSVIVRGSCIRKGKLISKMSVIGEDVILASDHLRDTSCPRTLNFVDVMSLHRDSLIMACEKFPEFDRRLRRAQVKLALWRSFVLVAEKIKAAKRGHTKKTAWDHYFGQDQDALLDKDALLGGSPVDAHSSSGKSWAACFDTKENPSEDVGRLLRQIQKTVQANSEATAEGVRVIQARLSGLEGRMGRMETNVQALAEAVKGVQKPPQFPSSPSTPQSRVTKTMSGTLSGLGARLATAPA